MISEECLAALTDGNSPIAETDLMSLSGIDSSELQSFKEIWANIDNKRRASILDKLIALSEARMEAEFNNIFKFCLVDEEPFIRCKAIEGLWECDDRTLVGSLITIMELDESEDVRISAASAIGKFAVLSQTGKMLQKDGERIQHFLIKTISNNTESERVIRRAIEAVAPFNTSEIQGIIQSAYQSDQTGMKCSSLFAMGKSCDSRWLPLIVRELKSTQASMRYEACNACAELGEESTLPHLIPLFTDEDHETQMAAIYAVGAIGGDLAKKALLHCLKSSDDLAIEAAEEALQHLASVDEAIGFSSAR